MKTALENYTAPLNIENATFSQGEIYTESFTQKLWDGNGRNFILVVPDEVLKNQPISHRMYAAMEESPSTISAYDGLDTLRDAKYEQATNRTDYDNIFCKQQIKNGNASSSAMIVFPLFYLAIIPSLIAATILTIQLLDERNKMKSHFTILHKIGMKRSDISWIFKWQFVIYYLMPIFPAIVICILFIFALGSASEPTALANAEQVWGFVGLTLLLFFYYLFYLYGSFLY